MQEELNQFEYNQVWHHILRPRDRPTIGTKWIFRNKLDESGNIVRNKTRLVAQCYNHIEGIDFEETFIPVHGLKPFVWSLLLPQLKILCSFKWMLKMLFLMILLRRRCMLNNLSGLLILHISILCLDYKMQSKMLYMIWNKLQELGMKGLVIFL